MATTSKLVELFNALADASLTEATATAFVEAAYENLLGLSGDFSNKEARVAYWVAQIEGGVSRADFASTFLAAGTVQGDLLTDAEFAANGVVLAALEALDETDLTLESVKAAAVAAAEEAAEEEEEEANAGETFTLTTDLDEVTGTAGADTIEGVVSALPSEGTFEATDVIDGGEGEDTLSLQVKGSFTGLTGTGSVKNVETIDITNATSNAVTFNTTKMSGIETIKVDANDKGITISNLAAAGVTLDVSNIDADATVTASYATDVTIGAADELTVALTDAGAVKVGTTAQKTVDVSSAGIETLNLEANGSANFVTAANVSAATAINVTGDADLKLDSVAAGVTAFDASTAGGDVTADLTGATKVASAKTGAGDDTVTVDAVNADATLAGGDGDDTLVMSDVEGTIAPTMTGFETLTIKDLTTGVATLASSGVSGLKTLNLTGTTDKVVTVAELAEGLEAVNFSAVSTNAGVTLTDDHAVTLNVTGAKATTANVAADLIANAASALEINVSKGTSTSTDFSGDVTANSAGSVVVTASDATASGSITANQAASVELNAGFGSTVDNLGITANQASQVTIDAKEAITLAGGSFKGAQSLTVTGLGAVNLAAATLGSSSSTVAVSAAELKGDFTVDVDDYAAGSGTATVTGSTIGANAIDIKGGRSVVNVTGGTANDTVTFSKALTGANEIAITLGSVSTGDKLVLKGGDDLSDSSVTLSGVDTIETADSFTMSAATVTGQAIAIDGSVGSKVMTLEGTANADTIDLSSLAIGSTNAVTATVKAGAGNDTIKLGALTESVQFADTNGSDTITGFTQGTDKLDFTGVTTSGTAATSGITNATNDTVAETLDTNTTVYVIDTDADDFGGSGTTAAAISDFTSMTDVSAFLKTGFTAANTANNVDYFVINDGDNAGSAYVYKFVDAGGDTTVDAAELSLIGTVTADGAIAAGDITV